MRSTSTDSGTLRLIVTFQIGTDPDQATINVNNRAQRATALLPEEVRRQGVTVRKQSSSILQILTMSSPSGRYDTIFISNYALINVIDELRRTPGVGDASLFGASDYSMRIWLRPDKVAQYNLTPGDIAAAVREQNAQFAAGRFGEEPMSESAGLHVFGDDPEPARRSARVREHHPALGRARRCAPPQGCGAGGARLVELRVPGDLQRLGDRSDRRLSRSRERTRWTSRPRSSRPWTGWRSVSRKDCATMCRSTRPASSRSRSKR